MSTKVIIDKHDDVLYVAGQPIGLAKKYHLSAAKRAMIRWLLVDRDNQPATLAEINAQGFYKGCSLDNLARRVNAHFSYSLFAAIVDSDFFVKNKTAMLKADERFRTNIRLSSKQDNNNPEFVELFNNMATRVGFKMTPTEAAVELEDLAQSKIAQPYKYEPRMRELHIAEHILQQFFTNCPLVRARVINMGDVKVKAIWVNADGLDACMTAAVKSMAEPAPAPPPPTIIDAPVSRRLQ